VVVGSTRRLNDNRLIIIVILELEEEPRFIELLDPRDTRMSHVVGFLSNTRYLISGGIGFQHLVPPLFTL
jgi:hypothetical protein